MTKSGETIVLTVEELMIYTEKVVITTIEKLNHSDPNETLTKDMIMKELDIGITNFQNKVLNGKHPLKMYGTPKKRFAIRSEFEAWRKKDWGRY